MQNLSEKINELPPDLRREAEDFVEFLSKKNIKKRKIKLRQDWGGGLEKFRDQYTSKELQKKSLEWRND